MTRFLAELGEQVYYGIAGVQLSLVLLAAPAATAGSVCVDRARGWLAHMFVTPLSDTEIVLGKLAVGSRRPWPWCWPGCRYWPSVSFWEG